MVEFQSKLRECDFSSFASLKQPLVDTAEHALSIDIPRLMEALPRSFDTDIDLTSITPNFEPSDREGGGGEDNPFGDEEGGGKGWFLEDLIPTYQGNFDANQQGGFIGGGKAKDLLVATGVPVSFLKKIWDLSDVSKDGKLDIYEFIIAMYLCSEVKDGKELPVQLESHLKPPAQTA